MGLTSEFRPCIDLHDGKVEQIIGGTLDSSENPATNFISEKSPAYYAELYKQDNLEGGHIIRLGAGNDEAARCALEAWKGHLQLGGGINSKNLMELRGSGVDGVAVVSAIFAAEHPGNATANLLKLSEEMVQHG